MRTSFLPNLSDAHECGTPQNESHPMPTRFATRRAAMTAEAQARAQVKSQVPEGDMALADLRRLTRGALAATLNINQASVAKMEAHRHVCRHPAPLHSGDGWRAGHHRPVSGPEYQD